MNYYEESFYLVESPDPNDGVAYSLAQGGPNQRIESFFEHSSELAAIIRGCIEVTGVNDPTAKLIAEFYETKTISKESATYLPGLTNELDPPTESLEAKLFQLEENNVIPSSLREDFLNKADSAINWRNSWFLDRNGLSSLLVDDGSLATIVNSDIRDDYGDDSEEHHASIQLGLTVHGYQMELIWRDNEPYLLSSREHCTLGSVALDGTFVPFVTILNPHHPAHTL